jgi:signal transduction histidine kinase
MKVIGKRLGLLSEPVFTLPPERLIAFARLTLIVFALVAISLDPPQPERNAAFTYIVAIIYLACAVAGAYVVLLRPPTRAEQLLIHAVDIVCVVLLMYYNQGPSSPFFVFFTFILLSATLRWDWRGAIGTTILLVAIFFALILMIQGRSFSADIDDLSRAIVRPAYLMVAGVMLGYVGAFQERSRTRLAKLVEWPGPDYKQSAPAPIGSALAHAAEIMRVPRVLIVWEQPEEPFRDVVLWSEGRLTHSRERYDRFGTLVSKRLAHESFVYQADRQGDEYAIDKDLRQTYAIKSAFSSPFQLPACSGRIFLLDRKGVAADDLLLAELIANRIGVDLEHHLLRNEREAAAAMSERARLARDLHDGVLQGLAAANIHLKLSSAQGGAGNNSYLDHTREILSAEQQRIRLFIEGTRSGTGAASETRLLAAEIETLAANLNRQWRCEVHVTVEPLNLEAPEKAVRNIRHFIAEAVSNAVRHGKASRIDVSVKGSEGRLHVSISDNGCGFVGLHGSYSDEELRALNMGPQSLCARARDMVGSFMLQTSSSGTKIMIEVPV